MNGRMLMAGTPQPSRPEPDEGTIKGPDGPRTPYPVDDPGIADPKGPGSQPDFIPGVPIEAPPRM